MLNETFSVIFKHHAFWYLMITNQVIKLFYLDFKFKNFNKQASDLTPLDPRYFLLIFQQKSF